MRIMNINLRRNRLIRSVYGFPGRLADLVCPPVCILCGALPEWARDDVLLHINSSGGEVLICKKCRDEISVAEDLQCPRCASITGFRINGKNGCSRCPQQFPFERVVAIGPYDNQLSHKILLMKHDRYFLLADTFTRFLLDLRGEILRKLNPDYVVPIPMHRIRKFLRSVNSPERIALLIARFLDVPCLNNLVYRNRWTVRQAALPRDRRGTNVAGAFSLTKEKNIFRISRPSIQGKKILLVDDVFTTGATSGEVARLLKKNGAASVSVAVLARTE